MSVSDMVLLVVGAPRRRRGSVLEWRAGLRDALNEDLIRDGADIVNLVRVRPSAIAARSGGRVGSARAGAFDAEPRRGVAESLGALSHQR